MEQSRRRLFLFATGALLASPISAIAQAAKTYRVGFLSSNAEGIGKQSLESLLASLRDQGYVVGTNLVFEARYAGGDIRRLPAQATALVGLGLDVIVASGEQAAIAVKAASATIPIVMAWSLDPVAAGLAASRTLGSFDAAW